MGSTTQLLILHQDGLSQGNLLSVACCVCVYIYMMNGKKGVSMYMFACIE